MKSSTLRAFGALHTWVGLVAGLFLFIAFYAGALSVFNDPLHVWETRSGRAAAMTPAAQAQPLLDALLRAHPEAAQRFTLRFPTPHEPALTAEWDQRHADGSETEHVFALSPQGQLVDLTARPALADLVYHLHYTAGLPESWGLYVLGVVCVLYGLALVSGVILYTPAFFKDLFALRIGKNLKRMWQDAHNAIGILSLPFHVMYAWSSAVLALGALLLAPFQYMVFDGRLQPLIQADVSAGAPRPPAGVGASLAPLSQLYATIEREVPGMTLGALRYRNAGDLDGQVEAYGEVSQRSVSAVAAVVLNAASGAVERVVAPQAYTPGTAMLRGLYALHFASFGGVAVQWMYFVLGLAGAFLFYSGNLLWIEARRKRRPQQARSARLMAQATLGVCLGCIAGIGALFLANKLAPWHSLAAWEAGSYYSVFCACLLWAFIRPPARAAHELLMLCAVLCLLLPLAQWWRAGVDPLSAIRHGAWVVAGVDGVALLAGWLYWSMARAVLRRGLHGDPQSVWSLR
ncbi:PepSY-associated TM helix domain-containing protein [Janthinobacterium agaricidamnosum]|uniref:PepSY-associated TM helix family protein n=1 Tax=Janthinobacterium agaricidamnosum NBRC 102515 = DSM 9628 TaxID=1349767 RepID=W0V4U6_9BURK|nr:PepSY-associated TM helix domain-containing protein [Janthinobacterium agaricidamnosum]CDG82373.1 pepSY-associated TM helix family protein [Janthinobacterium agaricidamnosum NBRC 102515 = DSM 9628]